MPFEEIMPPHRAAKGIGTGVRLSLTDRLGLRVSLAGEALAAIGAQIGAASGDVKDKARFKVLIDRDPALPRLRIQLAPAGKFQLLRPPISSVCRFITVGKLAGLPAITIKCCDCSWEALAGGTAIDIDLPRELRLTSQHQPVGRPSTSTGPQPNSVTLAGASGGAPGGRLSAGESPGATQRLRRA